MKEVQSELKSLKALVGSRATTLKPAPNTSSPSNSTPSTPSADPTSSSQTPRKSTTPDLPKFGITPSFGKGSLPAWQMAGHNKLNEMNGSSTTRTGDEAAKEQGGEADTSVSKDEHVAASGSSS